MQKKAMIVIGILLAAVLYMQIVLLSEVKQIHHDMLSSDNFASTRIDIMTGNQHKLQNTIDAVLEALQSEE